MEEDKICCKNCGGEYFKFENKENIMCCKCGKKLEGKLYLYEKE